MIAGRSPRTIEGIPRCPPASHGDRASGPGFELASRSLRRDDDPGQRPQPRSLANESDSARSNRLQSLPNPMILKPGRQLGPYRLLERLGQGGQGEVWKTRRLGPPGELVALKVLKPELAHNPARMAQFRREAQRGPRLKGPSLLAAYELTEIDGFHCMAMPFVQGTVASRRDQVAALLSFRRRDRALHSFVGMDQAEYRSGDRRRARRGVACAGRGPRTAHRPSRRQAGKPPARQSVATAESIFAISASAAISTLRLPNRCATGRNTDYMAPERLLMFAADEIKCDIYSMGVTFSRRSCSRSRSAFRRT